MMKYNDKIKLVLAIFLAAALLLGYSIYADLNLTEEREVRCLEKTGYFYYKVLAGKLYCASSTGKYIYIEDA